MKKVRANSKKLHKMMEDLSAAVAKEWAECGTAQSIVQGVMLKCLLMKEWHHCGIPVSSVQ
eukprot:5284974-Pyramimonas_sp.AAC.2